MPKPSSECYKLALDRFYRNEQCIVGFENTVSGYLALKPFTQKIYIVTTKNNPNYSYFRAKDVYLISEYSAEI